LLFAAFQRCIAALAQGELAYVQGELFVVFEFWFDGLRSLFELAYVTYFCMHLLCFFS
jgi:hypothetical protein